MQKQAKSNYRDILKTILEDHKNKNINHSQSFYAQKIGTSRSYLNLVLTKKKHLSLEKLDLLCRVLKLSPDLCLAVLRSFLRETSKQKYLTKALKNYITSFELIQKHNQVNLDVMARIDKQVLGSPLKSIVLAICARDMSSAEIHESLHDKSIDRKMVQETLAWLVEQNYLQKTTLNGEHFYLAKEAFLKTDPSNLGPKKYLPWLPVVADCLSHPELYRPGRIQSLTLSFDDEALAELSQELTRLADKILELSEKSKKTKAVYVQNFVMTLASR